MKSYKDIEKIARERNENKIVCKCGCRSNVIPNKQDRVLCNWCNHYVYRTPEIEFSYRLKEQLKKINKKENL